jgi:excisionase family DNA binding protein
MSSEVKVSRLLTVKELSKATGLATWRLWELVRKGKGPPFVRIGRSIRFPEDAVVQWIREQTNNNQTNHQRMSER